MSVFETMYAESLMRDLVRLSDTVKQADRERILARMVDNVYEAVRDMIKSTDLVDKVMKVDVDQDPGDIVDQIHKIIRPHFIDQEVAA